LVKSKKNRIQSYTSQCNHLKVGRLPWGGRKEDQTSQIGLGEVCKVPRS
jgi:hypothetical protein